MAQQNASRRAKRRVHSDAQPAKPIDEDAPAFLVQTRVAGRVKLELDRARKVYGTSEAAYLREVIYRHVRSLKAPTND